MGLLQKKTTTTVADLESERSTLLEKVGEYTALLSAKQQALVSLLSAQRTASVQRTPLQRAHNNAQAVLHEAREALARNLGKSTEGQCIDALNEAEQEADKADKALQAVPDSKRIESDIQGVRSEIAQIEASIPVLKHKVEAVEEAAHTTALSQIFAASHELLVALEACGPTVLRLRNADPAVFIHFLEAVSIDQDQLWNMMQPQFGYDTDYRPVLKERQEMVATQLASLKK